MPIPAVSDQKPSWDALYARELHNHAEDDEDEGTIWFDESNAEETVLRELDTLASEGHLSKSTSSFLDLGTGNGHMLFALREASEDDDDDDDVEMADGGNVWSGAMVGVDYSAASIDLAHRIAAQRHDREPTDASQPVHLTFETWDLLAQPPGSWLPSAGFDVVLDKGTFDAISLMPSSSRHPCAVYRENVVPLIAKGGFLIITSCNWTRDELVEWLVPSDGDEEILELYREAKYPSFTFGGRTGQSVVTLIFRRLR